MLIVDAHQDLAWNMLTFGRDYTLSAIEIRQHERNKGFPSPNEETLLGWEEYQRGQVALIFASLFAAPLRRKEGEWDILCYATIEQAHRLYREQLDFYHRFVEEHQTKFRLVQTRKDLKEILDHWEHNSDEEHPIGLVISMEGAEGVCSPDELEEWWAQGVRIIGLAWAGNRFCGGTREPGPLTREGYALLDGMAALGFILDLSHMDEEAALQALDHYPGTILASHANPAALLKGLESNRFLSDRLIRGLIEREGVIGIVPFNRFLEAEWTPDDGKQAITLQHVVAHIDYICQLAGDARHVGIGSDFDGGFGLQSVPAEIDTIADLQKLVPLLAERGYSDGDIAAILGKNWISLLQHAWVENP